MKVILHYMFAATVLIVGGTPSSFAQTIPNGDFENWITGIYEFPVGYQSTSNPSAFYRCNAGFNAEKVADPYHGSYAIRLTTRGSGIDACFGYFLNATTGENPLAFNGGFPISEKPTGIRGYFKSAIPAGDSAFIMLIFKNSGIAYAGYEIKFYGTHSVYTSFSYTFPEPLAQTPDTVIFGAASSDFFNDIAINGSMIQLDSISFTGITAQPSQMNGSFENWQTAPVAKPAGGWNMLNVGENGEGIRRSTDAFNGTYALELRTMLMIDMLGELYAEPAQISLGELDCNLGPCVLNGGIPYNQKKDTLIFRYKYSSGGPVNEAYVKLHFKKAGVYFDGGGISLPPASVYTFRSLPFDLPQIPDSVVIEITSGDWAQTDPIYASSVLLIDDLKFKSDNTGTGLTEYLNQKAVKVYPNPSNGFTVLYSDVPVTFVEVFKTNGQRVHTQVITGNRAEIQLQQQPKGVYFYKVYNKGTPVARGRLIIQ